MFHKLTLLSDPPGSINTSGLALQLINLQLPLMYRNRRWWVCIHPYSPPLVPSPGVSGGYCCLFTCKSLSSLTSVPVSPHISLQADPTTGTHGLQSPYKATIVNEANSQGISRASFTEIVEKTREQQRREHSTASDLCSKAQSLPTQLDC